LLMLQFLREADLRRRVFLRSILCNIVIYPNILSEEFSKRNHVSATANNDIVAHCACELCRSFNCKANQLREEDSCKGI
jgi:hypothetical protein